MSRSSGVPPSSEGLVNVACVVLHRNRCIGARERRQLIAHVHFQVPCLGPESRLKSGFACAGLLCSKSMCLCFKINAAVIFCLLHGSAFAVYFGDFAVSFLVPSDGPKNGTVKVLFFCSCGPKNGTAWRSHFWDRV